VNRTMFHHGVVAVFKEWIARLRAGDCTARDNMRRRMDEIITDSI
jgi:hypothetical protein